MQKATFQDWQIEISSVALVDIAYATTKYVALNQIEFAIETTSPSTA
jgi:hypothetical protein